MGVSVGPSTCKPMKMSLIHPRFTIFVLGSSSALYQYADLAFRKDSSLTIDLQMCGKWPAVGYVSKDIWATVMYHAVAIGGNYLVIKAFS